MAKKTPQELKADLKVAKTEHKEASKESAAAAKRLGKAEAAVNKIMNQLDPK
jgi:hypothetical protein